MRCGAHRQNGFHTTSAYVFELLAASSTGPVTKQDGAGARVDRRKILIFPPPGTRTLIPSRFGHLVSMAMSHSKAWDAALPSKTVLLNLEFANSATISPNVLSALLFPRAYAKGSF